MAKARFPFAPKIAFPRSHPVRYVHGGFGHRGDDCTFETLAEGFQIRDRKVKVISEIVHDADLADGKFGRKRGLRS